MLTHAQKNKVKKYLEPNNNKWYEVYIFIPSSGDDITLGAFKNLPEAKRFKTFLSIDGLKGEHEIFIDEWIGHKRTKDYKGQVI